MAANIYKLDAMSVAEEGFKPLRKVSPKTLPQIRPATPSTAPNFPETSVIEPRSQQLKAHKAAKGAAPTTTVPNDAPQRLEHRHATRRSRPHPPCPPPLVPIPWSPFSYLTPYLHA